MPSIWLICVCICNSTLFTGALSSLFSRFIPVPSIMVLAIIPSSFANGSNCAVPSTFTPLTLVSFPKISFAFSFSKKALHVIVLVPSYKSNIANNLPVLSSLESTFKISPSNSTRPLSTDKSATFTKVSFNFALLPYINGLFSSVFSSSFSVATSFGSSSFFSVFFFFSSAS